MNYNNKVTGLEASLPFYGAFYEAFMHICHIISLIDTCSTNLSCVYRFERQVLEAEVTMRLHIPFSPVSSQYQRSYCKIQLTFVILGQPSHLTPSPPFLPLRQSLAETLTLVQCVYVINPKACSVVQHSRGEQSRGEFLTLWISQPSHTQDGPGWVSGEQERGDTPHLRFLHSFIWCTTIIYGLKKNVNLER